MAADRERALVVRAREDGGAFAELYDFYLQRIYGFIYRRVQDRCVAEDLTSMTFQKALENVRRDDFRNDSFGGWLYRVASNVVIDHVRRDRRYVSLSEIEGREEPGDLALDALAAALDRDQMRRALLQASRQPPRGPCPALLRRPRRHRDLHTPGLLARDVRRSTASGPPRSARGCRQGVGRCRLTVSAKWSRWTRSPRSSPKPGASPARRWPPRSARSPRSPCACGPISFGSCPRSRA